MRDLIRRLPAEFGITVFLSSHLLSEVEQIANYIGIIHQGRLLFQGTLADLQAERQEHLTIGVKQPDQAMRCLTDAGWDVQRGDDGLLTVTATTRDAAAQINSLLVGQRLEVFHVAIEQASLEDIFLTLTSGKTAERATERRAA
jgi:ABC-2 type transport system ATP-binding protein